MRICLSIFDTEIYVNDVREGCFLSQQPPSLLHDATAMNLTCTNAARFHLSLPLCPSLVRLFLSPSRYAFSWEHDLCPSSEDPEERPLTLIQLPSGRNSHRLKEYKNHCGEIREGGGEQQPTRDFRKFFHYFIDSLYNYTNFGALVENTIATKSEFQAFIYFW